MANYVTVSSPKSRKTALLLCIFFGLFGIHRFYVGKFGSGLVYMCSMGLFCFGWIRDIWQIAVGDFTDRHGDPLREW